jgi:hypothetical protein
MRLHQMTLSVACFLGFPALTPPAASFWTPVQVAALTTLENTDLEAALPSGLWR